ncbi:hypothetical protein OTU49_010399 [Cherax quadricarinatus]|uniref:Uncharacterized protein n=1 Tax=Cherax quadricarinatus TaxID=27406 RepID=A0AAW0WFY8_CHEQU
MEFLLFGLFGVVFVSYTVFVICALLWYVHQREVDNVLGRLSCTAPLATSSLKPEEDMSEVAKPADSVTVSTKESSPSAEESSPLAMKSFPLTKEASSVHTEDTFASSSSDKNVMAMFPVAIDFFDDDGYVEQFPSSDIKADLPAENTFPIPSSNTADLPPS